MPERQLAIGKRFSLAGAFDGWGDDCYVTYRPANIRDKLKLRQSQLDEANNEAAIDFMLEYAKGQVIGGKVKVLNDKGESELADLRPDDIESLPDDMLADFFAHINGVTLDPKATDGAAPSASAPESSATPTAI